MLTFSECWSNLDSTLNFMEIHLWKKNERCGKKCVFFVLWIDLNNRQHLTKICDIFQTHFLKFYCIVYPLLRSWFDWLKMIEWMPKLTFHGYINWITFLNDFLIIFTESYRRNGHFSLPINWVKSTSLSVFDIVNGIL